MNLIDLPLLVSKNVGITVLLLFVIICGFILFTIFIRWAWFIIQASSAGVRISVFDIIRMEFSKVSPRTIIESKIMAIKAGLDISIEKLEAHYVAGGDVKRAVQVLNLAKNTGVDLDFEKVCAIDLAGKLSGQDALNEFLKKYKLKDAE